MMSEDTIGAGLPATPPRLRLILASASPRRLDLLRQAGIEPDEIVSPEIEEAPRAHETPQLLARRLAREKAAAAALPGSAAGPRCVLAADTVVAVGRRILPKAETREQALACLGLLSGRGHRVYTAVCVVGRDGGRRERLVETRVAFKRLSAEEVERYHGSGEWRGKAGGYAIQGLAGTFVLKLVGSYSAVVGLPLYETMCLLEGAGYPVRHGWTSEAARLSAPEPGESR